MIHQVFTVYDSKAEAYLQPFFSVSKGAAIRSFSDAINDSQSTIGKHPEDYILFALGSFDDLNCVFECGSPVSIGVGSEFVRSV